MNLQSVLGLVLVFLCAGLMFVFALPQVSRRVRTFRPMPADRKSVV